MQVSVKNTDTCNVTKRRGLENVQNELIECSTPFSAFSTCPTAYRGTPRVRLIHSKKHSVVIFLLFAVRTFLQPLIK